MSRALRIAVADDEQDMRDYLLTLLPKLGHDVVVVAANGRELVRQSQAAHPDLVITDVKMPDMDGIEAAAEVCKSSPVPVILITAYQEPEFVERAQAGRVFGYLTKPIKPADVEPVIRLAMRRFAEFEAVAKEATDLRQALESRKLVERAKGIVMKRSSVDEQEAYRRLNRLARNKNWKLLDVVGKILAAEEVFHELEQS